MSWARTARTVAGPIYAYTNQTTIAFIRLSRHRIYKNDGKHLATTKNRVSGGAFNGSPAPAREQPESPVP